MAFMTILDNDGRTAVKAFFYSYVFKGRKYMIYNYLKAFTSTLLGIKPKLTKS